MWIRQPVLETFKNSFSGVTGSGWEGESFWVECDRPVDLTALQEVEKVEMVPQVAVDMFLYKGLDEMAARVPFDRQLVVMTRVGDVYEFGEPVEVELSVEGNRVEGKISPLPTKKKPSKIKRQRKPRFGKAKRPREKPPAATG